MKKNAALLGALALSFAVAAPAANAGMFGGMFSKLKEGLTGKAKEFVGQARELVTSKFEALKDSAKTEITGFKNDVIKYGKEAVQKELKFLTGKALPALGKGLRATMEKALQAGWKAGKARAWAAWRSGPKGKGAKGMFGRMKFAMSEGFKGGLQAAKSAALKGGKANFSRFISSVKKHGRQSILALRNKAVKSGKAHAGNVVKAVKNAKPAKAGKK